MLLSYKCKYKICDENIANFSFAVEFFGQTSRKILKQLATPASVFLFFTHYTSLVSVKSTAFNSPPPDSNELLEH
jgi:hypothetical protein